MQKLQVIEFQGLAPSVFCGLYFADAGSKVTIVARAQQSMISSPIHKNLMNRGKKCICLSMKEKNGRQALIQLMKSVDIIIDPFRPGVLQKLKFGPENVWEFNPKAIYLRVSGYGQFGKNRLRPGHDLNYLAMAGVIPVLNQKQYKVVVNNNDGKEQEKKLQFPTNFYADFLSASLGVSGVMLALIDRNKTGKGQIVDFSLKEGPQYYGQFLAETSGKNKQQLEQDGKYCRYFRQNGKTYCVTSNSLQNLSSKQLNKLEKRVEPISKQYDAQYRKDPINGNEISEVKDIPKVFGNENQAVQVRNPFFPQKGMKLNRDVTMPSRGQHNQQILLKKGFSTSFVKELNEIKNSKL